MQDYHVILMDATVATGAAAMMAIRVLLDHDVPEVGIGFCPPLILQCVPYKLSWLTLQVTTQVN